MAGQCTLGSHVSICLSMTAKGRDLEALEARLGYSFANKQLLEMALTHSSAISPARRTERSYQRLEFLGDRVLGLVVADMLHKRLPKANEGELSRTLNALVRKETCAEIARQLALGPDIRLGDSEARSGGAEKEAIIADVMESVIGAVYSDGGFDASYALVEKLFGGIITRANAKRPDAKTALQEWAQGRGLEPPTYSVAERSGPDHAPQFSIAVALHGFKPEVAMGPSKKIAEHKAAEQFLYSQKVWKAQE